MKNTLLTFALITFSFNAFASEKTWLEKENEISVMPRLTITNEIWVREYDEKTEEFHTNVYEKNQYIAVNPDTNKAVSAGDDLVKTDLTKVDICEAGQNDINVLNDGMSWTTGAFKEELAKKGLYDCENNLIKYSPK